MAAWSECTFPRRMSERRPRVTRVTETFPRVFSVGDVTYLAKPRERMREECTRIFATIAITRETTHLIISGFKRREASHKQLRSRTNLTTDANVRKQLRVHHVRNEQEPRTVVRSELVVCRAIGGYSAKGSAIGRNAASGVIAVPLIYVCTTI